MTIDEAKMVKDRYDFIVGHSFKFRGDEVVVQGIELYSMSEKEFGVILRCQMQDDTVSDVPLHRFLPEIGVEFWIKYFKGLKREKADSQDKEK
jgi:hypothetical protein